VLWPNCVWRYTAGEQWGECRIDLGDGKPSRVSPSREMRAWARVVMVQVESWRRCHKVPQRSSWWDLALNGKDGKLEMTPRHWSWVCHWMVVPQKMIESSRFKGRWWLQFDMLSLRDPWESSNKHLESFVWNGNDCQSFGWKVKARGIGSAI
jgi:hypothetical protein